VHDFTPIFFLPGVPPQMKELLVTQVLPRLTSWITTNRKHVRHCVYRVFGLQENEINSFLRNTEGLSDVKIGYYPVDSEVHVSLTVLNSEGTKSDLLFSKADQIIQQTLGSHIYGKNQDTLASVVGELVKNRGYRISIAESCTGGLISSMVTQIAGSSQWYIGSVIAYSNELKENLLHVDKDLILHHGAVSGPVAQAMAKGIVESTGAQIGLAVTGIAGPEGGTKEKPVGTVYIGVYFDGNLSDHIFHFSGDRNQIQQITAQQGLDLVRRFLLETK
jgi:nicotinamide-nucleotide amidase